AAGFRLVGPGQLLVRAHEAHGIDLVPALHRRRVEIDLDFCGPERGADRDRRHLAGLTGDRRLVRFPDDHLVVVGIEDGDLGEGTGAAVLVDHDRVDLDDARIVTGQGFRLAIGRFRSPGGRSVAAPGSVGWADDLFGAIWPLRPGGIVARPSA